jgi:hypothetical protein
MECMQRLLSKVLVGALGAVSFTLAADDMKGFVGLGFAPAMQFDGPDPGIRSTARLEFNRIIRNVALEFRGSSNSDYQDFGGIIKTFKTWGLSDETATGIHLGLGLGGNFGDKYYNGDLNRREKGVEFFLHTFSRFLWDFGVGLGLAFDLAYEYAPITKLNSYSETQSHGTQRLLLGVMLVVDVD